MSKIKLLICIVIALIGLCFCRAYAANDIKLYFDNEQVKGDVSPVIINDRAMVPVRSVFEKMNAEVSWINSKRQVVIQTLTQRIVLTIDDKKAYVDGKGVMLDVAPVIVNNRTLIPVRFVSEALGYDVAWNNQTRSVHINSPYEEPETVVVKKISVNSSGTRVTVELDNMPQRPSITYAGNPQRFIADFPNAIISGGDSKKTVNGSDITEVRYAEHDGYARIVIESPEEAQYVIAYSSNSMIVTVDAKDAVAAPEPDYEPPRYEHPDNTPETDETPYVPAGEQLVVLDPGHGGWDVGAVGYNPDGSIALKEADANLAIALSTQKHLKAAGVNVIMTRQTNTGLGTATMSDLMTRCDMANKAGATLFVSIHNNSFSNYTATGTEILYTEQSSGINGVNSKVLAQNILTPLVKATGLTNRGIKNSPRMVVLKHTHMPAVLLECGFVSNPNDREVLTDSASVDKIGAAIAEGIIKTLKQID